MRPRSWRGGSTTPWGGSRERGGARPRARVPDRPHHPASPLREDSGHPGLRGHWVLLRRERRRRFSLQGLSPYSRSHFAPRGGDQPMGISIVSFGYKRGVPPESDLLFDTRFLPNPFFVDTLRGRSGLDREVIDYLEAMPEYREFRARIVDLMAFLIPQYLREGKSYLTVAIGCTGGRHRSVAMAEAVSQALRA